MSFPTTRLRRLRRNELLRSFVQETRLSPKNFIYPLFVCPGSGVQREIGSMPGNFHFSVDRIGEECRAVVAHGIPAVLLFGIPDGKDEKGSGAYGNDSIVAQAVRAIRDAVGDQLLILCDVCLCEYTSHGHCGVFRNNAVDNDLTLEILAKVAVSHAEAGADIVAPSGMMDGMVVTIRRALDEAGYQQCAILSYAVKFASAFYGPFREAAQSAPASGDRRGYQMDPSNLREALLEASQDETEGADILMVKPAMAYLDVVRAVRGQSRLPIAAYNVSGEYSMVKAAAARGWIHERSIVLETFRGIRRAGADLIISYHAKEAAAWLRDGGGE
jgi:porphobilinogen synthase